jgi:hypothetical protein
MIRFLVIRANNAAFSQFFYKWFNTDICIQKLQMNFKIIDNIF